jgi:hypothetical protein
LYVALTSSNGSSTVTLTRSSAEPSALGVISE